MNKKYLPSREIALFCDQTAMVLKAGIPLYDAMETLLGNYDGTPFGDRLKTVYKALLEKGTLHDALLLAGVFPPYMTGMVKVGEKTGRLEEMMVSLSVYYEREADLKERIKSAVTYPAVLVLMMAAVIAVLMLFVMPVFKRVYASLGADLSSASSASAGVVVGNIVLIVIAVLAVLLLTVLLLLRTNAKEKLMRFLERVFPAVRKVDFARRASRFASVFAAMLKSGCDLDETVEMACNTAPDALSLEKAKKCAAVMSSGKSFYEAVSETEIFNPLHEKMIAVGARSGSLDTVMERLSASYDEQAAKGIDGLVSAIEPTLVALLCIAIGGILLSVMLPLLSILSGMA